MKSRTTLLLHRDSNLINVRTWLIYGARNLWNTLLDAWRYRVNSRSVTISGHASSFGTAMLSVLFELLTRENGNEFLEFLVLVYSDCFQPVLVVCSALVTLCVHLCDGHFFSSRKTLKPSFTLCSLCLQTCIIDPRHVLHV